VFKTRFQRESVSLDASKGGRTKTYFRDDVNINTIVARHRTQGIPLPVRPASYGDVSSVPDYLSALLRVQEAQEYFSSLPAVVRDRFSNDPVHLLAFLTDEANRAEAEKLGLLEKKPAAEAAGSTGTTLPGGGDK